MTRGETGHGKLTLKFRDQRTDLPGFAWTSNRWYWLRLRHQAPGATNSAGLICNLWRADYDTEEPEAFVLPYPQGQETPQGFAGILPPKQGSGHLQVDYVLIKTPILPEIRPFFTYPPPL